MTTVSWDRISESEHIVQFCETDEYLMHSLSEFIAAGMNAGETCIVLATQPHRENLEQRLQEDGLKVDLALARGQFISLDAAAILSGAILRTFR